jgi:hypothetical protein
MEKMKVYEAEPQLLSGSPSLLGNMWTNVTANVKLEESF